MMCVDTNSWRILGDRELGNQSAMVLCFSFFFLFSLCFPVYDEELEEERIIDYQ